MESATPRSGPVPGAPPALEPSRQRAVLVILSATALMVMYVETMIIPGIRQFETFFSNSPLPIVSWILSAYLVVGVAFTPIAGKLGDLYGKKRVLVGILGVYFVAVTIAGFTPNLGDALGVTRGNQIYLLIAVRAVQGVGMAMFPLAFAMIGEEFPREKVAGAQGIVAAMFSAGASIGLFGGAWLTQTYGWQFTYHTMIPISFAVLVLTILLLRESHVRLQQRLDVPGAITLALTLGFFLLGLTEGPSWGWTTWTAYHLAGVPLSAPIFFVLSVVFLVAFLLSERTTRQPIVEFAKMAERNIWVSNVVGFLAGVAMFLMFIGLVARTEANAPVGLGKTALDFGFYSLPTTVANMIVAPFVGRAIRQFGPKIPMVLGPVLVTLGGAFLWLNNTTVADMIIGPIPIFVGIIMVYISMTNMVVVSSKPQETGVQTGMNQTFRNLGTAIGPVVGATILASLQATYHVGPVSFQAPSTQAFQTIFALIVLLGIAAALLSLLVRNFRFTPTGQRVESTAFGAPARPTGPPAAPSVDA